MTTMTDRKNAAISRGVGMTTQVYAERAENAEIWLDGSSIAAGVKSLLGIDPKEDYNDKQARVQL